MGSSSGKVLPESSSTRGYFCFFSTVVSFNNQEADRDNCKEKQQAWFWKRKNDRETSQEEKSKGVKERVCVEEKLRNPNAKFRAKFDPRVTARYEIQALIGHGSFSRVVRAEHRQTHQPVAIKLLERSEPTGHQSCLVELGVLRRVKHPNIIQLKEVFQAPKRVYLVLELATGGELLERVIARGTFRERDATQALKMVASGLAYLHSLGIIHRDLKPENLLYYHPGQDSRLIITDFGLACWDKKLSGDFDDSFEKRKGKDFESRVIPDLSDSACGESWAVRTLCGTPEYLAPEMVAQRPCGSPMDMWALGIISFILLSGSMPFQQSTRARLFRAILAGRYSFHGDPWSSISAQAKSFISGLLTLEPEERMSAQQALQHPWLFRASFSSNKNLHRSISRNLQRQASRASQAPRWSPSSGPGSQMSQMSAYSRNYKHP